MTSASPTFYQLNKTVHVLNILAGMSLPNQRIAYKLYCLMTEVVLMLGFVTTTDAFLNSDHVMDRFKSTAVGSASLIGLFNSIYQKYNYKRSQKALQNLDKVSVDFRRDLFGEHFDRTVMKEFRMEHIMLTVGAFVTALSALVYPYWSEFIPVDEQTERKLATPMRMPYMGEYATEYWPLSFLLCLAILYGNLKIIAAHCFYMTTLSQIKCCFMQLKKSLRYIIENEETPNQLKIWIQRHQDIQRVGNEFCDIYSPMFSIFLAYFVIVNTSIMMMSMSVSDLDLVMKISALSHVCMCAVLLYLSCNTGSCLEHESFTVGQAAYGNSWYTKQLCVKKYFQLIIMRSNHKVMCKCMFYPSLTLSNETYAKFFRFSFSVFLTIRQMVERRLAK